MVIKTDGEPALIAVQEAVSRRRGHEALCENPLAYNPQANEPLNMPSRRSRHR